MSGAASDTRAVRAGEELDATKLAPWLDAQLGDVVAADALTIEQFPGGHSNLTYLVRRAGVEYVLRRPPFGTKVKTAHDMGREFTVLSHLAPVYDKAPRPLAYCDDEAVLGCRFYVMERRRGVILRKELPRELTLDAATARRLCELLVDALAELHAVDYAAAGLGTLGKPAGYVERQVRGWTERYGGSRTDDIPAVTEVAAWLAAHLPPDGAPTLIHNDFKFDNLILTPALDRVTGVLDWEMATVGDPLMDFGTALGYWVEGTDSQPMQMMRFGPTIVPGMMTRAELCARYAERSGRDLGDVVFYYAFGLFKTAVVAQQIYYRFAKGFTKDPRFAQFIHGVRTLADQAQAAIARGTV
ncbi:MAG: phosphotransferase family protein [Kofleriaceae bacterium]|nr:phosphotransferase family protein [Myxococcales bacterium]MCB9560317.1 phosphotransferase family protein [Kofleriaceae bacterium]MCB9571753.1 phosphotransferase family protein [Kofleriaceae bacterium]